MYKHKVMQTMPVQGHVFRPTAL